MWRLAIVLYLLGGCAPPARGPAMTTNTRVDEFKSRVGFGGIPAAPDADRAVRLAWPNPAQIAPLAGGGWTTRAEITAPAAPGEVMRKWVLQKGDSTISIEVFVSSAGTARARERLVGLASATMTAEIPYVRAAQPVGDLAVMIRNQRVQDLIWAYRNVCGHVRIDATAPDGVAIQRALQAQMEGHLVDRVADQVPRLERAALSKSSLKVGETARVELALGKGQDPGALLIETTEADAAGKLSLKSDDGTSAEFEALEAGRTTIRVAIVDRATLLSTWREFAVEIVPSGS
jgi:hypothetical protein